MQPPDHLERKWPSAIEHFVHAISAADEVDEITWLKPILVAKRSQALPAEAPEKTPDGRPCDRECAAGV